MTAKFAAVLAGTVILCGCSSLQEDATQKELQQIQADTGLSAVTVPETKEAYLGKTHRGYRVLYHASAGDVWGRYAARLTMGELGAEGNSVVRFMTGGYQHLGAHPAGSPLDRLLAQIIGQPLSMTVVLAHARPNAPRLDVLSGYSTIKPEDPLPVAAAVGFKAGSIYTTDKAFASRLMSNTALMKRLKNLRSQYIRVDEYAVTFLWAGQEDDYSGMINDHGGYTRMLNAIMDDLADIADAITAN